MVMNPPVPKPVRIGGDIPALLWRAGTEQPHPAIIYLAGGGSTKSDVQPDALSTAQEAGITVLSFDMYQHGERRPADFTPPSRASVDQFLEFAEHTADDLRAALTYLANEAGADEHRIGIRAISLSASACLGAIGLGLPVRACLSIAGSGDYTAASSSFMARSGMSPSEISAALETSAERLAAIDPLQHLDAFPPCALMIVHGTADRTVPLETHRSLFDALLPYYADRPEDCLFLIHPGGHGIRPDIHRVGLSWLIERLNRP